MSDEPFGRQPKPIKVRVTGENAYDVITWARLLATRAEFKGDQVQLGPGWHDVCDSTKEFTIYPRAVND